MDKKLTVSAKDEKVLFPVAVRGLKTPVLKLFNNDSLSYGTQFDLRGCSQN